MNKTLRNPSYATWLLAVVIGAAAVVAAYAQGPAAPPLEATYDLFGLQLKLLYQPIESTAVAAQSQAVSLSFSSDGSHTGTGTDEATILLLLDLEPPELHLRSRTSDPFSGTYTLDTNCELTAFTEGSSFTASVSPDLGTLHLGSGFDEPGESGRSLLVGLAEGDALTTDSVLGRYHFVGLDVQLSAQPLQSTEIGAQGQILVVDFDAGTLTSSGTFEETVRLRLDDMPPSLHVTSRQSSPFTGTYTVTSDGHLVVDGLTLGRVSPDGNTIILLPAFDDPGGSGRGLMVGVREGVGLGLSSIAGTYRLNGLAASLADQPVQVGIQSQRAEVTFDGRGGFSDGGTEEDSATLELENDPPTLDLRSQVTSPGFGAYTVSSRGELFLINEGVEGLSGWVGPDGDTILLNEGVESLSGWVGPDGDTILLFSQRNEPGDSTRSIFIGTRSGCRRRGNSPSQGRVDIRSDVEGP
jgi:hypothetical protein